MSAPQGALRGLTSLAFSTLPRSTRCRHAARLAAIRNEIRRASRHHRFSSFAAIHAAATTNARPTSTPSAAAAATAAAAAKPSTRAPQRPPSPPSPSTTRPDPPPTRNGSTAPIADLTLGLGDASPPPLPHAPDTPPSEQQVDWARSFHGLSTTPFSQEASRVLLEPVAPEDIEVKPDGIVYLPEIKYRRILNRAFGPGAWGLAPRGETLVTGRSVTREYGLVVHGRLVSIARGEQQYFDPEGIPTATEGCKSNALMRCCKDLGIASELWDPVFIRSFNAKHTREVWVEHVTTKKKRRITVKKGVEGGGVNYPFKEVKS